MDRRLARPLSDERSERARTARPLASWPCGLLVKRAAAGSNGASSRRAGLQRMRVRPMTIPRFRPPQQTRSRETLDRILDAAERVLDEKSFTEATLAEIMERAGVTVGAFYRRFPDKDALLHLLDERFFHEMQDRAGELLDPKHWRGASIAEILSEFSRTAVDVYSTRRGVARSLFLRARVDPVIQATARQVNARCIELLRALLLDPIRRAEITHPDPERALALGFMMFFGALRETTVFGEVWPDHRELVGENLGDEMAHLYLAYLGVREEKAGLR